MSPPTSTPCNRANRLSALPCAAWVAAGAGLALAAVGAMGLLVIEAGLFPATAMTPHDPVTAWATHAAMIHAVRRDAAKVRAPRSFSAAQVRTGFGLYERHCVMCHGGPGLPRAGWTAGLTPTPPYLLDAARRWSPAELEVIVGDGIKMTAMPAWRITLSEPDTWSLVAFLEALPSLSTVDYGRLRAGQLSRSP